MNELLVELVAIENAREDANFPASYFRTDRATTRLVQRVNMVVDGVTGHRRADREKRLALLGSLFGRPISSTYDLTTGELRAFLKLRASQGEAFIVYLENSQLEVGV